MAEVRSLRRGPSNASLGPHGLQNPAPLAHAIASKASEFHRADNEQKMPEVNIPASSVSHASSRSSMISGMSSLHSRAPSMQSFSKPSRQPFQRKLSRTHTIGGPDELPNKDRFTQHRRSSVMGLGIDDQRRVSGLHGGISGAKSDLQLGPSRVERRRFSVMGSESNRALLEQRRSEVFGVRIGATFRDSSSSSSDDEDNSKRPSTLLKATEASRVREKLTCGEAAAFRTAHRNERIRPSSTTGGSRRSSVGGASNHTSGSRHNSKPSQRFRTQSTLDFMASINHDCVKQVDVMKTCELEFAETLVEYAQLQMFQADDEIVRAGEMGTCIYVLALGTVEALVNDEVVAKYQEGSLFGQEVILDMCSVATLRTKSMCDCRIIPRDGLAVALRRFPYSKAKLSESAWNYISKLMRRSDFNDLYLQRSSSAASGRSRLQRLSSFGSSRKELKDSTSSGGDAPEVGTPHGVNRRRSSVIGFETTRDDHRRSSVGQHSDMSSIHAAPEMSGARRRSSVGYHSGARQFHRRMSVMGCETFGNLTTLLEHSLETTAVAENSSSSSSSSSSESPSPRASHCDDALGDDDNEEDKEVEFKDIQQSEVGSGDDDDDEENKEMHQDCECRDQSDNEVHERDIIVEPMDIQQQAVVEAGDDDNEETKEIHQNCESRDQSDNEVQERDILVEPMDIQQSAVECQEQLSLLAEVSLSEMMQIDESAAECQGQQQPEEETSLPNPVQMDPSAEESEGQQSLQDETSVSDIFPKPWSLLRPLCTQQVADQPQEHLSQQQEAHSPESPVSGFVLQSQQSVHRCQDLFLDSEERVHIGQAQDISCDFPPKSCKREALLASPASPCKAGDACDKDIQCGVLMEDAGSIRSSKQDPHRTHSTHSSPSDHVSGTRKLPKLGFATGAESDSKNRSLAKLLPVWVKDTTQEVKHRHQGSRKKKSPRQSRHPPNHLKQVAPLDPIVPSNSTPRAKSAPHGQTHERRAVAAGVCTQAVSIHQQVSLKKMLAAYVLPPLRASKSGRTEASFPIDTIMAALGYETEGILVS